jgi:hypothetical protein
LQQHAENRAPPLRKAMMLTAMTARVVVAAGVLPHNRPAV